MKKIIILLLPPLLLLLDPIAVKGALISQATDTPTPTATPVIIPTYHLTSRITYGDAAHTIVINLLCLVVIFFVIVPLVLSLRRVIK